MKKPSFLAKRKAYLKTLTKAILSLRVSRVNTFARFVGGRFQTIQSDLTASARVPFVLSCRINL